MVEDRSGSGAGFVQGLGGAEKVLGRALEGTRGFMIFVSHLLVYLRPAASPSLSPLPAPVSDTCSKSKLSHAHWGSS